MNTAPTVNDESCGAHASAHFSHSERGSARLRADSVKRIDECLALCDEMDAMWFALLSRLDLTVAYAPLSRLRQAVSDVRIVIRAQATVTAPNAANAPNAFNSLRPAQH